MRSVDKRDRPRQGILGAIVLGHCLSEGAAGRDQLLLCRDRLKDGRKTKISALLGEFKVARCAFDVSPRKLHLVLRGAPGSAKLPLCLV